MFKLALGAGHRLETAGKRCLKALDPNETREWVLNDRICDKVETLLSGYDGIEVLRVDDTDGKKNIDLIQRVKAANDFGADFALSVHHNSGVNGGPGGGIVAYVGPGVDQITKDWQKALYDALIDHTGLRGNRAAPLATGNFYVLNATRMPAVLLELGFMDSSTDVPIILSEKYADQCAAAIVEIVARKAGLNKKVEKPNMTEQERFDQMMEDWLARQQEKDAAGWSEADRKWAERNGIIFGDGSGKKMYRSWCTREQMVAFLHRLADLLTSK